MYPQLTEFRLTYIVALVMPLSVYALFVAILAMNLPIADDYGNVLMFLIRFQEFAGQPLDQWQLIFSEANQHRNAFSHVIYLLQYWLRGEVNFYELVLIGNLGIALLCLCYARQLKGQLRDPFILLILLLLILQPQSWGNMLWAMGSIANHYVLLFSFLAIWGFVHASLPSTLLACLFALLATFTQGNGILCFPAVILLWLLQYRYRRPPRFSVLLLLGCAVIAAIGFFDGAEPGKIKLAVLLKYFTHISKHYLILLGSSLGGWNLHLSMFLGAVLLIIFVLLARSRFPREHPVLFCFMLFLLLSSLAVSLSRANLGIPQAASLRYRLISNHFMALEFIGLLYLLMQRFSLQRIRLIQLSLLLAFSYSLHSYIRHTPDAIQYQQRLRDDMKSWLLTGRDFAMYLPFYPRLASNLIMIKTISLGLYDPFDGVSFNYRYKQLETFSGCNFDVDPRVDFIFSPPFDERNEALVMSGKVLLADMPNQQFANQRYLILCGDEHNYRIELPPKFSLIDPKKRIANVSQEDFDVVVPRRLLAPGEYRVGIQLHDKSGSRFGWWQQPLTLQPPFDALKP